jgi:CheY-like chemotaxis protein
MNPERPAGATPPEPGAQQAPLNVLVVDDDELDRLAVRRCLQQSGLDARLDEAASAAETLERIGSATYDCVLLDYYIPGVDGLSLLQISGTPSPTCPW